MKLNHKGKFLTSLTLVMLSWNSPLLFALDSTVAETAVNNGVAMLEVQQDITEGGWADYDGLDYVYTAAAVEALRATNQRTGAYYAGLAWLENHHARNNDLEARKIMALVNRGNNIEPDLAIVHAAKRETDQSGWGLSGGYTQSPLESALVLQALVRADDATNLEKVILFLIETQHSDGGWGTDISEDSDYWLTAEVALALVELQHYSSVGTTLIQATGFLETINTTSVSTSTLARSALALYKVNGLTSATDTQMSALLTKQLSAGDWGNILDTANAINSLAHALNINPDEGEIRVLFDDEQLRSAVNLALGQAAYRHITRADLDTLTSLDLRNTSVTRLGGLQSASNLTDLLVNSSTDVSAVSGIDNLTVLVDTDLDNVADNSDNCPAIANSTQANVDGDGYGDACDSDIDGDQMPNSWESLYSFNSYSASDAAIDSDVDGLSNLQEYLAGTNPRVADTDGDLVNDGDEVAVGSDPLDPFDNLDPNGDEDGDGLTNLEEIELGTDLNNPDTDGDNMEDGDEVDVGRNPLLNEPVLIIIINGLLLS